MSTISVSHVFSLRQDWNRTRTLGCRGSLPFWKDANAHRHTPIQHVSFCQLSFRPGVLQDPGRHQSYTNVVFGTDQNRRAKTSARWHYVEKSMMHTLAQLKGKAFIWKRKGKQTNKRVFLLVSICWFSFPPTGNSWSYRLRGRCWQPVHR